MKTLKTGRGSEEVTQTDAPSDVRSSIPVLTLPDGGDEMKFRRRNWELEKRRFVERAARKLQGVLTLGRRCRKIKIEARGMNEHQKKQQEILASRQKIIYSLKAASSLLRKAREECRVTVFWNLSTAKEIEELAEKIEMLADEVPIPAVPEQRGG